MRATFLSLLRPAAIGAAIALVGVVVVYLVADAAGEPFTVTSGGRSQAVPLTAVIMFTLLGAVIGLLVAVVASRLRRPRAVFLVVTVVALVLYAFAPFAAADRTSTAIWLNVLHLVAFAAIVPLLARALPATRHADSPAVAA